MSEESTTPDLAAMRRGIEAASFEEWAAFAEQYCAANAVWDMGKVGLGVVEGLAAIVAFIREYWLMWEEHNHYVEDMVDVGQGVVYAVVREDGRIKGSTADVEARNAYVVTWDGGKIVLTTMYTDIDEARPAAELLAEERG
jgi:ketosteroid isomerase-like protein